MKRKTLLFLLFSIPFTLFGQTVFGPQNVIISERESNPYPTMVHGGDVDVDGDMDLLIISSFHGKLTWVENLDGLGTFSIHQVIADENDKATDVKLVDLDNDGDLDVLSASAYNDQIAWYEFEEENDAFGDRQIISTIADAAVFVFAADIDDDGDKDVLSASLHDGTIAWYENLDGQGAFGVQQVISLLTDYPRSVSSADLDSDGDLDVLSASATDGKIAWYENLDGQGTFGMQQVISIHDDATFVSAADLDGDGDIDVFSTNSSGSDELLWYKNVDGQGTFSAPIIIVSQIPLVKYINVADVDGDNDIDFIAASYDDNNIFWIENEDGIGTFGDLQIISTEVDYPRYAEAVDIDYDGDLDVLSASASDDKIAWYENLDGLGDFGNQQVVNTTHQAEGAQRVITADFDNDGDMDVLSASQYDNKVAWYENLDGQGTFHAQQIISTELDNPTFIEAADLDGDNDKDVLSTSYYDDKITWYENLDGQGNFGPQIIISDQTGNPSCVITADLDGDGDLDVLTAALDDDNISWHKNLDGQGNFSDQNIISIEVDGPESIFAADIDGDGDIDVLSASTGDEKIAWYENLDGLGTFGNQQIIYSDSYYTRFIQAIDIDGDGDLDVLYPSYFDDKVSWHENLDGLGNFGDQQVIAQNVDGPSYVEGADFDGDGDVDILYTLTQENKLAWHENLDGLGTFGDQQIISMEFDGLTSAYLADINGDGDLDVLATSFYDSKVVWYKNLLNKPIISGYCFYDENENKIKDPNEVGLLNHSVNVEPNEIINFTNDEGFYRFILNYGDYLVTPQLSNNWELTTDSTSYSVSFQGTAIQNINFGLKPIVEMERVEANISSSSTRCGFQVPFWVNYENTGTKFVSGQFVLEMDDLTSLIEAVPIPDSIEGNLLIWYYTDLPPSYSEQIELLLQMPSVDYIGENMSFIATTFIIDDMGELHENYAYEYNSIVNCSYDPNDKLVYPEGEQEENYMLFGEELEYTIRFQNTGTDTAFTVRIEDQLDSNLDWSTFHPVAASHDYIVNLYETGLAEFIFEDILLPDSTTNEIKSHGFMKYRIKPLVGLSENTEIQNTADIFFDFNPPVETNTTLNTAYECGAAMQLEMSSLVICENDSLFGNAIDLITATEFQWELIGVESISGNEFSWVADTTGVFDLMVSSTNPICARDTIIQITVNQKPVVELSGFLQDTVCQHAGPIDLPSASPIGGVYSGIGVISDQFDPMLAGVGSHWVFYTFYDGTACTVTDSVVISVEICASVYEVNQTLIEVFPNPFEDYTTIRIGELPGRAKATLNLQDVNGRLLQSFKMSSSSEIRIKGSDLPSGVYFYELKNGKGAILGKGKLIKL